MHGSGPVPASPPSGNGPEDRRTAALAAAVRAGGIALALCVAFSLATPGDSYWINDCGNKALVAQRLAETRYGELNFSYPARAADPRQQAFPIQLPYAVARGGGFVSAYPPAYPALAAPFAALFGPWALRLPAAVGVALCAGLMVLWLEPAVGARRAGAAGLFLALASPLFFYGITVWEHSLAVAAALAASLLAVRAKPGPWVAAGALVAGAGWLREEMAAFGVALAVAAVLHHRRGAPALWLAAGAALPAAGLLGMNSALYGDPFGAHVAANSALETVGIDAPSAWRVAAALLAGLGEERTEAAALAAATAIATLAGWWLAHRGLAAAAVAFASALGLGVWGYGSFLIASADRPLAALVLYNGLLVQLPCAALVGVGLSVLATRAAAAPLRVGVYTAGGFAAIVAVIGMSGVSGYGVQSGFGVHWGPRILLPALPAAVALAALALVRAAEKPAGSPRLAAGAAIGLAVAGLASSSLAGAFLFQQKADARRFSEQLRALAPRFVVTTQPMLAQHLPALWEEKPTLLVRDLPALERSVHGLSASGVSSFLLVGPAGGTRVTWIGGLDCRMATRYRGPRLHYFDLDVQRCDFR